MGKNLINYAMTIVERGYDNLVNAIVNYVNEWGGAIRVDNPNGEYAEFTSVVYLREKEVYEERRILALRVRDGHLEVMLSYAPGEGVYTEDGTWVRPYHNDIYEMMIKNIAEGIMDDDFTPIPIVDEKEKVLDMVRELNEECDWDDLDFDIFEKIDSVVVNGKEVSLWQGVVKDYDDETGDSDEVYMYVVYEDNIVGQVYCDGAYPMDLNEARTYQFYDGNIIGMLDPEYQFTIELTETYYNKDYYNDSMTECITFKRLVALSNKYGTGIRVNKLADHKEWIEWEDNKGNVYVSTFVGDEIADRETLMV